jgi:nucleoside-diphosphate-sugar epimerase
MKQISILGCGWLGLPLAKSLISAGYHINGSTTSESKLSVLKANNIAPFLISLHEKEVKGDLPLFLHNSSILIIDVPPKLRGNATESFVDKIQNTIPFIEKSSIEKVLFVSSTSVYGDDNEEVIETTLANPDSESGKQLVQVESLLQKNKNFKTTIVRFAGLIGADRHPVKFLAGRENIENPDAPVNLIHQDDCIGIIKKIIDTDAWDAIFNAAYPLHPTRKEYYTQKAIEKELPLPHFMNTAENHYKIISSAKILKELNYTFVRAI